MRRTAERREREKKEKRERSAPASSAGIDTSARQYETQVANPAATAAAIIAAGRRARGETDDKALTPSGIAGQIIQAGRKARGEKI